MKPTSRLFFLLLIATGSAFAGTCGEASLSTYTSSGFTCTLGDKTYGGFDALLVAVNGTPTSLSDITVDPTTGPNGSGFNFNANFNAPGGIIPSSVTLALFYTGFAPSSDPFTEGSLQLANPMVTGLGTIVAAKAFCEGGSFTDINLPLCDTGIGVNLGLTTNITDANLDAKLTFELDNVTELGVLDVLTIVGPDILGSASLTGIDNYLTSTPNGPPPPVPEPSSLLLLGTGLMSYAGFTRKYVVRKP